jgi:flavin reductase (DIM6/NTAB) family NADH-FMN oxidoreductase RutF
MTAEQSPQVDSRSYRNTIGLFASGVTIITTRLGEVVHGMTANAVSSVSLDPTLLLVCLDRRTRMHDLVQQAGLFAVNVLAADQEHLSVHFAGRGKDGPPPPDLRFVYGSDDTDDGSVPTIAGSVTAIRCQVEAAYPGGDHTIVLGRVIELRTGAADAQPLIWFGGHYRQLAVPVVPEDNELGPQ